MRLLPDSRRGAMGFGAGTQFFALTFCYDPFFPMCPVPPMRLLRIPKPFDHPHWIFEPKMDGFRALAHIEGHLRGDGRSRRQACGGPSSRSFRWCAAPSSPATATSSKSWPQLAEEIAHSVRAHSAILDGEICCLEPDGTSNFKDLLFRREWPFFVAFDVLAVDGEDIRTLPLSTRKVALRRIMPNMESRLRYLDHIKGRGIDCSGWPVSGISKAWWGSGGMVATSPTLAPLPG